MKKHLYLLLIFIGCAFTSMANPGDTTWVQANNVQLNYYNNFDTVVVFPKAGTTYRKIYMIFTLGKYACPSGSQYCASWDYTVLNYLMTKQGDTIELGRFITPYATTDGNPRTPATFTYRYIYDVTDFYPLLKDTAAMRILYSGYSGGFTGNIRFAFIEGTPERNVTGVSRLWTGSHAYGNTADPINTHFPAITQTVPANTQSSEMKMIITGHGSDNNYCCEFQPHFYNLVLNGTSRDTTTVWRPDCGSNELYPQTGTWVYERANWCPGALVYPKTHKLPGLAAGSSFDIGLNFEDYTGAGSYGSYTTEAALFHYGAINKTLDASLEDIIAPTNFEGHFRENPLAGTPTVKVRNTGSTAITALTFEYGVVGSSYSYYNWTGNINPLEDAIITLPEPWGLRVVSGNTGTSNFHAKIIAVNSTADNDSTNNTLTSTFNPAPSWPVNLIVNFRTNHDPDPNNSTVCATSWKIYNLADSVVAQRTNADMDKTFNDTLLLGPAVYKLVVTDVNCSGLHWWANSSQGTGSIRVKKLSNGAVLSMNGNVQTNGTYNDDFGCGFTQYFTTNWPTGVNSVETASGVKMEVYPSPARNITTVSIDGMANIDGTIKLLDITGQAVIEIPCHNSVQTIDVSTFANGVYTVLFVDKKNTQTMLREKLLIVR